MYIYTYTYTHTYAYTHMHIYICIHIYVHICLNSRMYIYNLLNIQAIAFGLTFKYNLQIQSHGSVFNNPLQKRLVAKET